MAEVKKYVLLEHTKPTANVYIQISQHQRAKIDQRKHEAPFIQIGFMDKDGKNKVIRLKLNCNTIYQDEQIKNHNIPANEKFTNRERSSVYFKNGILITKNKTVQAFLDASPQNEKFFIPDKDGNVGSCDEITGPLFKELDEAKEKQNLNSEIRKRVEAANVIMGYKDVTKLQELYIRLYGSHVKPPTEQDELENSLMEYLDDSGMEGVEEILKEKLSVDDEASLLVAKAVSLKVISFEHDPAKVVKIGKGDKVIDLKDVPADMADADKQQYFIEFLLSDAGATIYKDLKKQVAEAEKKDK